MSMDFVNKLKLYKTGKLDRDEARLIEEEIEKYEALREYLEDADEDYLGELKDEIDKLVPKERVIKKNINKKMVKKIITLSLTTIAIVMILMPILFISTSSLLGKIFRVDSNRFMEERSFSGQFLSMVAPQIVYLGGSDHTEFYKQKFTSNYIKGIGHRVTEGKIEVNYSFGRLKTPKNITDKPLGLYHMEQFYAIDSQTYFQNKDWNYLEKAPNGTRAQIFITFKAKLSPAEAVEVLGKQYSEEDFNITMLANVASEIVLGNSNPSYYYSKNNSSYEKQEELNYINKFNSFDNEVHKQVLLFELSTIKKYKSIADFITVNYSEDKKTYFDNIDNSISYVEENGVQYVGAIISGDTKELLKLRDNPNIFGCSVEEIVVW